MRQRGCCRRGVNVGTRALDQPVDHGGVGRHEGPAHARGLAQRAHVDQLGRAQVQVLQHATAVRAQHAETMGVIDHQPGTVRLAQREQFAHGGNVAIHAEDAVGDHDAHARRAGLECTRQRLRVGVRVNAHLHAREPCAVDDGRVVEGIGKDFGARGVDGAQTGQHGQVGHIARAQVERAGLNQVRGKEAGQPVLERVVRGAVPADQVRGPAARAIAAHAFLQRIAHAGIGGQAQVVVTVEAQYRLAIDDQLRRAGRVHPAAAAAQARTIGLVQGLVQFVDQGEAFMGRRAHSGLPAACMDAAPPEGRITASKVARTRSPSMPSSSSLAT